LLFDFILMWKIVKIVVCNCDARKYDTYRYDELHHVVY